MVKAGLHLALQILRSTYKWRQICYIYMCVCVWYMCVYEKL